MQILNLVILLQQLENYKNFYYNKNMKNIEQLNELANKIIQLEQEIQKNPLGKNVQLAMNEIENIMRSLSFEQLLKTIETVEKGLK